LHFERFDFEHVRAEHCILGNEPRVLFLQRCVAFLQCSVLLLQQRLQLGNAEIIEIGKLTARSIHYH
jgi:hypothetical protein